MASASLKALSTKSTKQDGSVTKEELEIAMLTRIYLDVKETVALWGTPYRDRLLQLSLVQFYEITGANTALQRDYEQMGIRRSDLKDTRNNICHAGRNIDEAILTNFAEVITSSKNADYLLAKFANYNLDLYANKFFIGSYGMQIGNISSKTMGTSSSDDAFAEKKELSLTLMIKEQTKTTIFGVKNIGGLIYAY